MQLPHRRVDWQSAALISGATLLGAAWALFNLRRAGGSGFGGTEAQLVWAVFATPAFAFVGWLLARWREHWLAALVCFSIYFFAIFLSARLELLLAGDAAARADGHALYFRLTLIAQTVACLVVAVQRSIAHGTMNVSTEA